MIRLVALLSALWGVLATLRRGQPVVPWNADDRRACGPAKTVDVVVAQKSLVPALTTGKRRARKRVRFGNSVIFDYEEPECYADEACFRRRMQEIRTEIQTRRRIRTRLQAVLATSVCIVGWTVFRLVYK